MKVKAITITLDSKGRCCGRKPLHYKLPKPGYLFCIRCSAHFTVAGQHVESWAWRAMPGGGFWPPPQANDMHLVEQHAKANALWDARGI